MCIHTPPPHTHEIYWNDLHAATQLFQSWLSVNRKSKNSIVAQSPRLDVLAGQSSVYSGILKREILMPVKECMNVLLSRQGQAGKQQKRFLLCPYIDFQ